MSAIYYISHNNIDKKKWDNLITDSAHGLIYSRSFFLDAMCQWDALVKGDYEYVMPLPFKKKASFKYCYNPFFMGQLGITGKSLVSPEISKEFIDAIPASFLLIDIHLNESNLLPQNIHIRIKERINYVLPLQQPYEAIATCFNKDARKNIRQAVNAGLFYSENADLSDVFDLYKKAYGHLAKRISEDDYLKFYNACQVALQQQNGFIAAIRNTANKVVAAAFFAIDNKRIYYLLGAPSAEGKKANATHLLINEVIKKYAETDLMFDFEGSDIPSVASFYKKFAPETKVYQHIIINRLPFWIKWLKK